MRSLDRADIGASDLAGIPWPAQPLNNHIFVENQAGYVDNAGDFAYDPERAMADLDAAGWVAGADGIREKDGQRLTVELQPVRRRAGLGERGAARAVPARRGRHRGATSSTCRWRTSTNVLDIGDFQMIAFAYIGTPFPFAFEQIFGNCSDGNYANSYIPEIDELVDEIGRTVDVTERTALANQADVLLWDNASTLPLYQAPDLQAINANIANYGAFGFQTPVKWEDVGWMA